MREIRADVIYESNNGVLAVKPTNNGRLRKLIMRTIAGDERVWVFIDPHVYSDEKANTRIDHKSRGVSCGTRAEGDAFLELCRKLGLTVLHAGFFVPFSNGERRYARDCDDRPMADYDENELRLMRWDLPNEARLRFFIENAAASEINT